MIKSNKLALTIMLLCCTIKFTYAEIKCSSLYTAYGIGITDSLSAREIWNNYVNALGGIDKIKTVRDRATTMQSYINGRNIVMTIYQKKPNKMKQIITTPTIIQNVLFDGSRGVMEVSGNKMDITGRNLEKLTCESMIDFIINIDSLGIKLKSDGLEKVNNKNAYKIEVILPSGSIISQYFDAETWLKVRQVEYVAAPQKNYLQETYFDDYREVKGVKYPYSIKETLGSQTLDFSVTSIKINTGLADSLFVVK